MKVITMEPKQLIRFERGNNSKSIMVVDEVTLKEIMSKVGTSRVAVIAGTGSDRSGKSYLSNFIGRFFNWEQDDEEDWMGWADPYTELEGFEWRGGKDVVTSGIWIWPEPFMTVTSTGEVIAVLLIDTQGTLNAFTTEEESVAITALCLLLSSLTIYNVKNDIEEGNFQLIKKSLQLCSDIFQKDCNFQDLLFTVRDWNEENGFGYGAANGENYLKEKLKLKAGLTEEARISRDLTKSNFKRLSCSLFPDPGEKVRKISHKGHLADMGPAFQTTLEEIPRTQLNADNLHSKAVAESSVEFMKRFKTCIKLLNEHQGNHTSPQQNNSTHLTAFEMYKEKIDSHPDEFFGAEDVTVAHNAALEICSQFLENENHQTAYGTMKEIRTQFDTMVQQYYREVVFQSMKKGEDLGKVVNEATNAVKETYHDDMSKKVFSKDTISENHIRLKHDLQKEEALSTFLELIPKKYKHLNLGRQKKILEAEIEVIFAQMKNNWQSRKETNMLSQWELSRPTAIEDYKARMKNALGGQSFFEEHILREYHEKVLKYVMDRHCNVVDYGDTTPKFQEILQRDLNEQFLELERANSEKMIEAIEGKLEKALKIATQNYKQELTTIEQNIELREEEFVILDGQAKEKIRNIFLTEIKQEPDHIKAEFLNKLNSEFAKQSQTAKEKLRSAILGYSRLIDKRKTEIQGNAIRTLEKHLYSHEIYIDRKTEEIGKNLIEQSMVNFGMVKANHKVPSKMLAIAQSETIDAIKRKIEEVAEMARTKSSEYKEVVKNLVEECFSSYTTKMENFEEFSSEECLKKKHDLSVGECVQILKNKCIVKDENWLRPFITVLQEKSGRYYESDIKKIFLFELEQKNFNLRAAELEASKLYREDMGNYFTKTPFTLPAVLLDRHSKLAQRIANSMTRKFKLEKAQKGKLIKFLDEDYKTYETKNAANTPTDDPAIGIDLGTTNTCAAIFENGESRMIPNEKGGFLFPSFVSFTRNGELVGNPAKDMAYINPQNTIFGAKRLIGRKFNDKEVQEDMKNWPFEVISENNIPKIKIDRADDPKIFAPETISAKVLKHVKDMAQRHIGKEVKKAVITVPAYFNDNQRQATKDAGEIAGFDVLQIITEPTAAAMAFHLETKGVQHERNVLVYDLGGGTFDVVVLNMKPGGDITVLSIGGDTHLGGEDFDGRLLEEIVRRYKARYRIDLKAGKDSQKIDEKASTARILRRLRNACEEAKKNISAADNKCYQLHVDALNEQGDLMEPVTRMEFEDLNMEKFLQTLEIVGKALSDAKLGKGDINDIVLVGGSTRIPKIRELLQEYFDGKIIHDTVHPDEAVAQGAAIHAAILNGNREQNLRGISLKDVAPLSLGIEVHDRSFSRIIHRNTQIPATATKEYRTAEDNQTQVEIIIFEGDEKIAKDNHLLGKFLLKNIPPKRQGVEKILVKMDISKEGILKVTATCCSTGAVENITIEDHRGRLTGAEKEALKSGI